MKLPEQVKRLGVIVGLFLVVVITRFFLLPESWISARPHQAAKVVREMAKPMHYAGMMSCRDCHQDEWDTKLGGFHRKIGCENCHGPAAAHVANKDDQNAIPPKHRDREFCLGCHGFVASRPNGFPQVDGQKHKPGKRCVSCHDAHDPKPDSDSPGLRRLSRPHRRDQGDLDACGTRLHRMSPGSRAAPGGPADGVPDRTAGTRNLHALP